MGEERKDDTGAAMAMATAVPPSELGSMSI